MRCPNRIELQSYTDGELRFYRAERITQHIRICLDCRRTVSEFQQFKALFHRIADATVPATITAPTNRLQRRFIAVGAVAAVIVLIIAISGIWYGWHKTDNYDSETELVHECLELHYEARL